MNPIIAGSLITGGAGIVGSLLGKKKTEQVPLETPEQKAARQSLLNFGLTGKHGGFEAGAEVPLQYGNFDATGIENQGLGKLQQLMNAVPEQYRMGDDALKSYLGSPLDIQAQFDPFKEQVNRQIGESERGLKRSAGFAGNLYSTNTIRGLGDIQARGNETLTSELARLTDSAMQRRLQAIPLAYQSAEAQQSAGLQQVGASQQYGGLVRQLNNQQAQLRDQELLRRRQELQLPIEALGKAAGQGAEHGIPSIQTSPYQDLLGMVGKIGGQYVGNELAMNQYKRFFPGGPTTPATPTNYQSYMPERGF